jgi:host factor-I protein
MDNKPAQNIQDTFLNTVRKDKTPITIYLVSGVKLTGKIRSFDKYSVLLENNSQEQLILMHSPEFRPAAAGPGAPITPGSVAPTSAPAATGTQSSHS